METQMTLQGRILDVSVPWEQNGFGGIQVLMHCTQI